MNKKKAGARVQAVAPVAPVQDSAAGPGGGSEIVELGNDELSSIIDEVSIEEKLKEWVSRENTEAQIVRTYLYKYENPVTGDHKVLCDRIDGDIPDPHSVGVQFGSGRYIMIVTIPGSESVKARARGLRFRLHARYDDLRKRFDSGAASAPAIMGGVAAPASGGLRDGIELVKTVVDMIVPLLATKQAAAPDMSRVLEGQYDMMQSVLKKSLSNSQELIGEIQRAKFENGGGVELESEPDFLSKIMPLVEKFLPVLMGGGAGANATAAAIRALPEFGKITRDTHELRRVVEWLDRSQGKAKTDAVLNALRVRRPGADNGRVAVRVPVNGKIKVAAGGVRG